MALLVLTVIGDDRPGLVDALAGVIAEHGANWEESRMAHLADKFAGIVLVQVADNRSDQLTTALYQLDTDGVLQITVEHSTTNTDSGQYHRLQLELVGQDHPGIVHDIAHLLAEHDVSIEELETETSSASMAGGDLFQASLQLCVPSTLNTEDLRGILETLADELMVDITFDPTQES